MTEQSSSNSGMPSERRNLLGTVGWQTGMSLGAGLILSFMLLPLIALIVTTSWSEFRAGLSNELVMPALKLSFVTTLTSTCIVVVFGTPLAWFMSRRQGRLIQVIETLVRLPVVLPPAVAGVALLLAFGRMGLVGSWFASIGWSVPFTLAAVVMAAVFVSAPFYLQSATAAFRNLDQSVLTVARSLGASPGRVFFRIALPLAAPGLIAGMAMAWARALGEFGATLMFAGNLTGKTQTLTLAIYTTFESDLKAAQSISVVLVVVAFTLLFVLVGRSGRALPEHEIPGGSR